MSAGKAEDSIGNIKPLTPWTPIIPEPPLDTPDKLQAYLNSCPPDLKDLDLRSRRINSLVGIRFPPGLKSLLLNFNNISELIKPTQHGSGVVFPPGLEVLELHDNQIERLKGVQFPPSLKILTLNGNKIRSLQEVQFPPRLEVLDLYDRFI